MDISVVWAPILGGVLVGVAGAGMLLTHGRTAGISGFMRGILSSGEPERGSGLAFLVGTLCAGALFAAVSPSALANVTASSLPQAAAAGLLVGFGSQLGNGCTSGHTFGLGRLSLRSVVALSLFVAVGAVSLVLSRLLVGGAA